jgi:hypothetical protein
MTRKRKRKQKQDERLPVDPSSIDSIGRFAPVAGQMLRDGRLSREELADILGKTVEDWVSKRGQNTVLAQFASHRLYVLAAADPPAFQRGGYTRGNGYLCRRGHTEYGAGMDAQVGHRERPTLGHNRGQD